MTVITIESGIKIKSGSELRKLKPVLDNWIEIVREYSKAFQNHDACWWYTERANVGTLAAAAWRTKGWLALEEYSTSKRGDEAGSKNGRCDLYMAKKITVTHLLLKQNKLGKPCDLMASAKFQAGL